MTLAMLRSLAQHPWWGIAALIGAFLLLLVALKIWTELASPHPELPRKVLHAVSGLLTLAFPFVFAEAWPVLLLTSATAAFLASVKYLPCLRRHLGRIVAGVERHTFGEIYFPLAVALVFTMARGESTLLFIVPILVLTVADAASALIGMRYGFNRYVGVAKTFEGSAAFVVVAFFCIHVPLLIGSGVGRSESLLIAATLSLLLMLVESSAPRGLDNLLLPVGSYFILRAYLSLDSEALILRLLVTIGLIVLVMVSRRRAAVDDDKLFAGAFVCYLAGALVGWLWLVFPVAAFIALISLRPSGSTEAGFLPTEAGSHGTGKQRRASVLP